MKDEKNIKLNKHFKEEKLLLSEFHSKDINEQNTILINILKRIYANDTELLRTWVNETLKLSCNPNDATIKLPKVIVEKKNDMLIFKNATDKKKSNWLLIIIYILILLIGILAGIYWTISYFNKAGCNKDIDSDGNPDLNINNIINLDTNNDNKPDLNIDYKGNQKAVFNIDKDGDGKADFNLVNYSKECSKVCTINCDTNDDGWPDINIDLDGDGKVDVDIDTDGDCVADMNIDTNGDGKCNLMCDTDSDGTCDKYCIGISNDIIKHSGATTVSGTPNIDIVGDSFGLVITYNSDNLTTYNVLPDDMQQAKPIPDKIFTIENTSSYPIIYRLVWKIYQNDFETNNLKYTLTGNNGGISIKEATVPKSDGTIATYITIPPKVIQTYTLSFRMSGTSAEQNIDQNRTFSAIINAEYDDN